jgi:hypothetical protein
VVGREGVHGCGCLPGVKGCGDRWVAGRGGTRVPLRLQERGFGESNSISAARSPAVATRTCAAPPRVVAAALRQPWPAALPSPPSQSKPTACHPPPIPPHPQIRGELQAIKAALAQGAYKARAARLNTQGDEIIAVRQAMQASEGAGWKEGCGLVLGAGAWRACAGVAGAGWRRGPAVECCLWRPLSEGGRRFPRWPLRGRTAPHSQRWPPVVPLVLLVQGFRATDYNAQIYQLHTHPHTRT